MSAPFSAGRRALVLAVLAAVALIACMVHASVRRRARAADAAAIAAVARRLPSADLALSGGSRWLRAPTVEEPWGAFADGPAAPDPDPASAMAPPRELAVTPGGSAR
jgi:hypothetical protein